MSCHFLVADLHLLYHLVVSLVYLLEEGFLEVLLLLDETGNSLEECPHAGEMLLVTLAVLVATHKCRLLALIVHAEALHCVVALTLQLGLADSLQN